MSLETELAEVVRRMIHTGMMPDEGVLLSIRILETCLGQTNAVTRLHLMDRADRMFHRTLLKLGHDREDIDK